MWALFVLPYVCIETPESPITRETVAKNDARLQLVRLFEIRKSINCLKDFTRSRWYPPEIMFSVREEALIVFKK